MNAIELVSTPAANHLLPNAKELRALREFVSTDETRSHLATLWLYSTEVGYTHVATDGHTMITRRAGTHRTMPLYEIAKLEPHAVSADGTWARTGVTPPAWAQVLHARDNTGKLAASYGMNPSYFARVGDVERAAGLRAAEDYRPATGTSAKNQRMARQTLKESACAAWTIPSDPLDGWFFKLSTDAALWEGIIMPRRA